MIYSRFAIYYVPPPGALAAFGARWLGWDIATGRAMPPFDFPSIETITASPHKYGFHGTLKPPFRLAQGETDLLLQEAVCALAGRLSAARTDGVQLSKIGSFLALTPVGPYDGLRAIAEACVREIDRFRAPPTDAEMARRRKGGLSARQDALLQCWGYPYVMEEFHFHMTLTGSLPQNDLPLWSARLQACLPNLPAPFWVDQIALCGEREDGYFELIQRYDLSA